MNLTVKDYKDFRKFALERYANYTPEEIEREFYSHGDLYKRYVAKLVLGENNGNFHNRT
jgi:hypothetical protein